jgi:hypothetical protein
MLQRSVQMITNFEIVIEKRPKGKRCTLYRKRGSRIGTPLLELLLLIEWTRPVSILPQGHDSRDFVSVVEVVHRPKSARESVVHVNRSPHRLGIPSLRSNTLKMHQKVIYVRIDTRLGTLSKSEAWACRRQVPCDRRPYKSGVRGTCFMGWWWWW